MRASGESCLNILENAVFQVCFVGRVHHFFCSWCLGSVLVLVDVVIIFYRIDVARAGFTVPLRLFLLLKMFVISEHAVNLWWMFMLFQ